MGNFQHFGASQPGSFVCALDVNGSETARWPGNLNLRLDGLNFHD
jgi:hypothetical protein